MGLADTPVPLPLGDVSLRINDGEGKPGTKELLRSGKLCLRPTSQSRIRSTAPLVGEPLAKPGTLRGLPRPLLLGEVAMRSIGGEVV